MRRVAALRHGRHRHRYHRHGRAGHGQERQPAHRLHHAQDAGQRARPADRSPGAGGLRLLRGSAAWQRLRQADELRCELAPPPAFPHSGPLPREVAGSRGLRTPGGHARLSVRRQLHLRIPQGRRAGPAKRRVLSQSDRRNDGARRDRPVLRWARLVRRGRRRHRFPREIGHARRPLFGHQGATYTRKPCRRFEATRLRSKRLLYSGVGGQPQGARDGVHPADAFVPVRLSRSRYREDVRQGRLQLL